MSGQPADQNGWPDAGSAPRRISGRIHRWFKARPLAVDAALALGVFMIDGLATFAVDAATLAERGAHWRSLAMLAALVGAVPVAIRRRALWPAVGLTTAHLTATVIVPDLATSGLAVLVVAYTAAGYQGFKPALLATTAIWFPPLALLPVYVDRANIPIGSPALTLLLINLLTAAVCFFVGRTVHNRRAYVAALEDRARTAELNHATLTAQAVNEERRRIARELHDVVAHHVSVMGVLATGSRRMLTRDPAAADEALATIEETGRTALREMRRLLSVLRADSEPAGELAPQPDLAGVDHLVEQVREAGLPVTLRVEGTPGPMDSGVALTVYRIVQEALTNALKHAGAATAAVHLAFGTDMLEVEVCDTGRGPQLAAPPMGHGLLGMRERVSLYGGTLRTGPRPGGGYRLSARIPIEALNGTEPQRTEPQRTEPQRKATQ